MNSLDHPYGRRQSRTAYFGSVVYDAKPWLQIGADLTYATTVVNRGFDVLPADLALSAGSFFNPFNQNVHVSLNETASRLGENYSEARLDFSSVVLGLLLDLPAAFRLSLDGQYARNISQYRGLAGVDPKRWQTLVDTGRYNPLRDTQVFGPPDAFYDEVLIYHGGRGQFATLSDYDTLDVALRATNDALPLPTGPGLINVGADYRRNHLASFRDQRRYGDGTLAEDLPEWEGRTLGRYSIFGELQGSLLSPRLLPHGLRGAKTDLAVRYIASDRAQESNVTPTLGLKFDFAGGFSLRGTFTTSNRYPTPQMSRLISAPSSSLISVDYSPIVDPVRNESYAVPYREMPSPDLLPEEALTQTAGLIFQRGTRHRFRAGLDFVDTRKVNEIVLLDSLKAVQLEHLFPDRVERAPLAPDDPHPAGSVVSVITGLINIRGRHSQNWNLSLDYAWTECLAGRLELYGRLLYFKRYDMRGLSNSPIVDELETPDGLTPGLLKYRANFGAGWSNQHYGFGVDGHYFHSRILPRAEWAGQGRDRILPNWQFDAYLQSDLGRWLPWQNSRYGLRGQLRVNNVLGRGFPRYLHDPSGAGVQPYGDWRGTTYSLSLTATF